MTSWLVVLGVGLGSYLFRLVPLAAGERMAGSERSQRIVHLAGTAALTALIVTSLLHVASAASSGTDGGTVPGALLAVVLAALASTLVAIRGRSMLAVVAAGSVCYLVADLAHHALVA